MFTAGALLQIQAKKVSQKYIILHAVPFEKGNGLSREELKEVAPQSVQLTVFNFFKNLSSVGQPTAFRAQGNLLLYRSVKSNICIYHIMYQYVRSKVRADPHMWIAPYFF